MNPCNMSAISNGCTCTSGMFVNLKMLSFGEFLWKCVYNFRNRLETKDIVVILNYVFLFCSSSIRNEGPGEPWHHSCHHNYNIVLAYYCMFTCLRMFYANFVNFTLTLSKPIMNIRVNAVG